MKARLVEDNNFERGIEPKKGLDIGQQRSDNPHNYANQKSFKIKETNEEFLDKIIEELRDFHMSVSMDWNPPDTDGNQKPFPPDNRLSNRIDSIENEFNALISLLKSVKR